MTRTYTTLERIFLERIGEGMWIGSTFMHQGKLMRVTEIGRAYKDGRQRLIDFEAKQIPDKSKPSSGGRL